MALRIKLNGAGIREVLKSAPVEAAVKAPAERAAQAAIASAPHASGEYAGGIEVITEQHADRVVAHVLAKAPYSMLVEAHTGNLARALDAAAG